MCFSRSWEGWGGEMGGAGWGLARRQWGEDSGERIPRGATRDPYSNLVVPANAELRIRVRAARQWCPFITAAVIILVPGRADQVESPLTRQLGETPPTYPTAAPRTLETRPGMRRQEVPASQGAFGQKSSLVAKLFLGPGPISMATTGQAGAVRAQGPSAQLPARAVGNDQRLFTLGSVPPTPKPSLATRRGDTHV